ncbi:hypothetical protein [Fimbriimonas ginsengisoli]|uniref:PIN domain-containing protein n=1 Tax=Fimbriimonas ginsengisoli Gsoil 348 TaxID=661478 RepID=A0A068NRE8_FIMGI|nr:hypothetical protein [Fimbriimonas ginsengisoli]AIE85345.1 hypothetical protein OP10G_1977 [Fimbriimonas ginsengisoli Gsoil 348]
MPEMVTSDLPIYLWDLELAVHYIYRDETYARFRPKAQAGLPHLSVFTYAEALCILGRRAETRNKLQEFAAELKDQFTVLGVDEHDAEMLAELNSRVRADGVNRGRLHFWNAALSLTRGYKILTIIKDPYVGLLGPANFA